MDRSSMPEYNAELESLVRELNEKAPPAPAAENSSAAPAPMLATGSATGSAAVSATGPASRPASGTPSSSRALDQLLENAIRRGASDILFIDGCGVGLRIDGQLHCDDQPVLRDEVIRSLMLPLLSPARRQEFDENRSCDFCFVRPGVGRFRTNLHLQRGTLGAALRVLPDTIPTLASLNLPPAFAKLIEKKQGLILVTGPTGSGKTSTLAALVGIINEKFPYHIVTIEDPIEYFHKNRRSVFEQIEIGHDAKDFGSALRSVLRQNPDVILVGEMRDPETVAIALTAAETGHLVLSTLHTNDAVQAIGRIVDVFPTGRQTQIRQQLSLGLVAIIAQQLVPAKDGTGRYPAVEVLLANTAVRHLLRKGEDHMLGSQLTLGRSEGMMMMEQSLADLVRRDLVSLEMAQAHSARDDELRRYLAQ